MKKIFFLTIVSAFALALHSQSNVLPAPPQKGLMFIKNATIHVGDGTVIENGTIQIRDGKIEKVGKDITIPAGETNVVDANGKQVYPGLILPVS